MRTGEASPASTLISEFQPPDGDKYISVIEPGADCQININFVQIDVLCHPCSCEALALMVSVVSGSAWTWR